MTMRFRCETRASLSLALLKFALTLRLGPEGRWLIVSDMDNAHERR